MFGKEERLQHKQGIQQVVDAQADAAGNTRLSLFVKQYPWQTSGLLSH
jgi:hypothetical protein